MGEIVRAKTYRHGHGVAVRFPEEFGFKPGQLFEATRQGNKLVLRCIREEPTPPPSATPQ